MTTHRPHAPHRFVWIAAALLAASPMAQDPGPGRAATPEPQDPAAPQEIRVMPRPQALAMPRGDSAIQIDGVLIDWSKDLPVILLDDFRQLSGTGQQAWGGIQDLSARAFFQWDDDDCYVAVVVRDDRHRPLVAHDGPPREVPPADSIVLTFDPQRDTRSAGPDARRGDDREYWLGDVPDGDRRLVIWDRYRGSVRFSDVGALRVKRDDERGITTYEARLPWSEILAVGQKPTAGMVLDLQIVINDLDELEDLLPQTRIGWTFGMSRVVEPGELGALMLVDGVDRTADRMPEFPPRPEVVSEVPDRQAQAELLQRLRKTEPVAFTTEQGIPQTMGGTTRQKVLEALEDQLEQTPRLDFLEFNHRMHRRMSRELSGLCLRGMPAFWLLATIEMMKRVAEEPPAEGFRVFRLPQGGWFVRSRAANFAIDPAGPDLAAKLGPGCDFVLLTQPLSDTKRSDQLMLRLLAMEVPRPVFTHVRLTLPLLPPDRIRPVAVGESYELGGVRIQTLGSPAPEGSVPLTLSFALTWPDGSRLVVGSPQLIEERVPRDQPIDCLILSAFHPYFKAVGHRLDAGVTLLDDVLQCSDMPGPRPRVRLADAWRLQQDLGTRPSVLLAPGESWDVQRKPK